MTDFTYLKSRRMGGYLKWPGMEGGENKKSVENHTEFTRTKKTRSCQSVCLSVCPSVCPLRALGILAGFYHVQIMPWSNPVDVLQREGGRGKWDGLKSGDDQPHAKFKILVLSMLSFVLHILVQMYMFLDSSSTLDWRWFEITRIILGFLFERPNIGIRARRGKEATIVGYLSSFLNCTT